MHASGVLYEQEYHFLFEFRDGRLLRYTSGILALTLRRMEGQRPSSGRRRGGEVAPPRQKPPPRKAADGRERGTRGKGNDADNAGVAASHPDRLAHARDRHRPRGRL